MLKIQGRYNEALVYTDDIEESAIEQIRTICNMEFSRNSKIRIMPDVHTGAGCTIGTTMTLTDALIPNLVGVDIGCGMLTAKLKEREIDLEKLDELIREKIPYGRNVRKRTHPLARQVDLHDLRYSNKIDHFVKEARAIGSLGGGNHFIEVDKDEEGNLYLVIHSGSRHLGKEVACHYQKEAARQCRNASREDIQKIIDELKEKGEQQKIEETLSSLFKTESPIPKDLAYVKGSLLEDYLHDMRIMQKYADINRKVMLEEIVNGMDLHIEEEFTTVHNYIDMDQMILRKGAVSALKGEKLLIPINMRDGSLICIGKGNEEWNCSAPHGAGRLFSRSEAFRRFSLEEFTHSMEGIYTTTATSQTIDECPMAYKPIDEILANIEPTVEVLVNIKPVYNFKAQE